MDRVTRPGPPEAIFVVGVSRSGTTLMRRILERSPDVAIAPENHYLAHRRARHGARAYFRRLGDLGDDAVVRRIVEQVYGGDFQRRTGWGATSPFWQWLTRHVARGELQRRLLAADRSERGLWSALLRTYADAKGRPIMGEKTPAHLEQVPTIVEWFPDCRVVHMIRDPRAVYVSRIQYARHHARRGAGVRARLLGWLANLPVALSMMHLVQTAVGWREACRLDAVYAARYGPSYRRMMFEDVVRRPDESLPGLFDFLGIELPPDPTSVKVVSRGVRWGEEGLDADAADRWREHIGRLPEWCLRLVLGGWMKRLGYTA